MYQRILVPTDGSATASRGLVEAIALARLTGGSLCILHMIDDLSVASRWEGSAVFAGDPLPQLRVAGARVLAEAKALVDKAGVAVETVLVETFGGRVSDMVVSQAQAWQADLVVVGTHGRRGIGRMLLGSDAEQIVRIATVPVLLVRAGESQGEAAVPVAPAVRAVAEAA